jgi:hypothetical protein
VHTIYIVIDIFLNQMSNVKDACVERFLICKRDRIRLFSRLKWIAKKETNIGNGYLYRICKFKIWTYLINHVTNEPVNTGFITLRNSDVILLLYHFNFTFLYFVYELIRNWWWLFRQLIVHTIYIVIDIFLNQMSNVKDACVERFLICKRDRIRAASSNKVYQLLVQGHWFSADTPASSTTKTGRHDIAEILLKVALNTKIQITSKS